jgi:hypothetical protein
MLSIWNNMFWGKQAPAPPMMKNKLPGISSLEYEPLDINFHEIRMLTIMPRRAGHNICCRLDKVSLIEPGNYVALSYCWGNPSITTPITVNDICVKVTVNLENALRHLERKYSVPIWVHELCVNQADDQERGLQVRLMKQVYEKASQVYAWVGGALDDSSKAMQFLRRSTPQDAFNRHEKRS